MYMKMRLVVMNYLEFAVWGAYLTCMGNYLGVAGLGSEIAWFYAIQGIVSIFMPTLMGIIADRYVQPQRLLGICHFLAGGFMLGCWWQGAQAGFGAELPDKSSFVFCYTLSVAFFMPTLALSNTTAFKLLKDHGYDTVQDFPAIRMFGTVGFIATMWFVNCAVWGDGGGLSFTLAENAYKFQYTHMQFLVSGVLSLLLCAFCFIALPQCRHEAGHGSASLAESLGLNGFKLFKTRKMAQFFIFSALLGMCLQVTNGYAGPFITSFKGNPVYVDTFAANNATLLTSVSQVSEALCILTIPFFLKHFSIKVVMLISMLAWVFRFAFFGLGNPAMPGVIMFILSCLVYGVAFDFFNVSGSIFVYQECDSSVKASAQGIFMMMNNGVGATVGTLAAGAVVNRFCSWQDGYLLGDWQACWFVFAAFALVVAISFALIFHPKENLKKSTVIGH